MSDEVKARGDGFDYEHEPGTILVCVVYNSAVVLGCIALDGIEAAIEHGDALALTMSSEPEVGANKLLCWIIGEMGSSKPQEKGIYNAIVYTAVWLAAKTCTNLDETQVNLHKDAIVYLFLRKQFSNGRQIVGCNTVVTPPNTSMVNIIQKYSGEAYASVVEVTVAELLREHRKQEDERVKLQEQKRVAKEAQLAAAADLANRTEEQRRKQAEHRAAAAAAEQARLDKIRREAAEAAGRLTLERKAKVATLPSRPPEVKARIKARKVKDAVETKTTQSWRWERWTNPRGVG